MIRFSCDKCHKMLEVSDDLAGKRVECPSCHDVNTVPTVRVSDAPPPHQGSASAKTDRASAAGFPADSGPEETVLMVRPAFIRAHPFRFALLALLALAGLAGVIHFGFRRPDKVYAWGSGALTLLSLAFVGGWRLSTLGDSLKITNKRSIERTGLLSKRTTEVLHDNIRNFQINQSAWDRVLNLGQIGISSSGQDGIEIVMNKVPQPNRVKKIIDLYRPM